MNRDTAQAAGKKFRTAKRIPFDRIPDQSQLFLDFQNGSDSLHKYFPNARLSAKKTADLVLSSYETDRNRFADVLLRENVSYGADKSTLASIERFRNEDCVAVVTGQQAGLYGGPIYTLYKALSAIKYANKLDAEGINAVPVFWIASEDHDFEEIRKTFVVDTENKSTKLEVSPEVAVEGLPVGFIKLDQTIAQTNVHLFESLTKTEYSHEVAAFVNESYFVAENFASAFTNLLVRLLKDTGMIFVSPLNKQIRAISAPIFEKAIEHSESIGSALLSRSAELERASYHSQVLVEENFFPFFHIDEAGSRNALRFSSEPNRVVASGSDYEFEKSELISMAKTAPERLSPNALMRPIVQDYLFPTVTYFGGAAEISYFAQNSVIYEVLGRPVTPIRHRASMTIIEPKLRRTLVNYDLEFEDLFRGEESVLAEIVERHLNPDTSALFDSTRELFSEKLDELDKELGKTDPTLSANLVNRRRKILWHLSSLRKKFHRAELVKDSVINRRLLGLFQTILPGGILQERTINSLYFINNYGERFIDWIYDEIDPDEKGHQILSL